MSYVPSDHFYSSNKPGQSFETPSRLPVNGVGHTNQTKQDDSVTEKMAKIELHFCYSYQTVNIPTCKIVVATPCS